jgi:hypothetical protein
VDLIATNNTKQNKQTNLLHISVCESKDSSLMVTMNKWRVSSFVALKLEFPLLELPFDVTFA